MILYFLNTFSFNNWRVLKFYFLSAKWALFLLLGYVIGFEEVFYTMKMKYVKFTAFELDNLTCRPEMIKTYGTLSSFNKEDRAEGELPNLPQHLLIPPIHKGNIPQFLSIL